MPDEEREQLVRWSRRRKSSQALALRSRIVLGCAQMTVGKWRARFVGHRLDGLTDDDRPGRPTSITLDQVQDVGWLSHPDVVRRLIESPQSAEP